MQQNTQKKIANIEYKQSDEIKYLIKDCQTVLFWMTVLIILVYTQLNQYIAKNYGNSLIIESYKIIEKTDNTYKLQSLYDAEQSESSESIEFKSDLNLGEQGDTVEIYKDKNTGELKEQMDQLVNSAMAQYKDMSMLMNLTGNVIQISIIQIIIYAYTRRKVSKQIWLADMSDLANSLEDERTENENGQ